ncbi:MAG: PQQ-binding-like beta-propeller repeat protein [Verrucomicrobiota bacterium]
MYDVRGRLRNTANLSLAIARTKDRFEGPVDIRLAKRDKSAWKARAQGSFLKPADGFDPAANWPCFAGPAGTLQTGPNGPALVDDLARSRPLWRSESHVPVSYGNAADDRYATRAAGCRSGGGSSSPVFADGVIYIAFYVPNRSVETDWSRIHESRRSVYSGEGFKKLVAERQFIEVEVEAIEDHWRPLADEVMVAMDARTGETLWRTTWPLRAYNLQTHKHRGTFGVPLVAGGKVFYPSFNNSLQVMDAETGKPLWEFPEFENPPETKWRPKGPPSQSPLLLGNTVVWSIGDTTYGLAADTGMIRWENRTERFGNHSLRDVMLGQQALVLVAGHHHGKPSTVRLIDPVDGATLWTADVGRLGIHEGFFANLLAVSGDKLVAYRYKAPPADPKTGKIDKSKITDHINTWRLSKKGLEHLWEDDDLPPDEGPHFAIARRVVYGVGKHLVRCLDLETGKMLGEIVEGEFPHPEGHHGDVPRSNPLLIVAGDKLILSPEGQHGKHGFVLFDADPKKLTLLGDPVRKWAPPHATTTAYGRQPIVNPIVDGRMFFRGGNGIYCYDLRKQD